MSLWALRWNVIADVLDSRFGVGWGFKALLFAALAALAFGRRERS